MASAVEAKLGWIRVGAGARFDRLELSLIPTLVVADGPREAAAAGLARDRGWAAVTPADVLAMPSVLVGTVAAMVETLLERRARHGISYLVVSDRQLEAFAPVVARLAGR